MMKKRFGIEAIFVVTLISVLALGPSLVGGGTIGVFMTFIVVLYLAYSWNIVGGIIGELSIAHIVAWGIGGYGIILLSINGLPLIVGLVFLALIAAGFSMGVVILAIGLRLEGLYLAVLTLVIAEIAIAAVNVTEVLGRNEGIRLLPADRLTITAYHLIGVALVVGAIAVNRLILRGSVGLRWLALRDDLIAAQALGVHVRREKILAYGLAGGLAAVGGAFQAHYLGFAQPETALSVPLLIIAILCVFAGGPGTLYGPAIGALVIQGLASAANILSTDVTIARVSRLAQYVIAFLLIRMVVSRSGGDDLLTIVQNRVGGKDETADVGVDEMAVAPRSLDRPTPELIGGAPALEVRQLTKSFGGLEVLKNVSFDVRKGEFVALVGPNGAGKTTVCNIVTGFLPASGGSVLFEGQELTTEAPHRRFEAGIVRTFQTPRLFPRLTLLENVAVACEGDKDRASEALSRVGIRNREQKAQDATLFEHRMVEVARALAADARLLILDEPLAGLSPQQRDTILGAICDEIGADSSVMIIEHLIPVIAPVVHRMVVTASGVVIADGVPDQVLREPSVIESYLGQPVG